MGVAQKTEFIGISMGIESGSQRMLDFIGKGITLDQIYKVDSLLTSHKFYKSFNFMTCLPTETATDLKLTLKLIIRLAESSVYSPFPFVTLHKYVPLLGAELFNISIKHGFVPPNSIDGRANFDNERACEIYHTVRSWLSGEIRDLVFTVDTLIEEPNALYLSSEANHSAIFKKIEEIKIFVDDK